MLAVGRAFSPGIRRLTSRVSRLPPEQVRLQVRDPVEEQDPVQVVQLVLEHDRLKPLRADLHRRAVPSLGADSDAGSAAHIARVLGNAQAAFAEELLPFTVGDLGVEQAEAALARGGVTLA